MKTLLCTVFASLLAVSSLHAGLDEVTITVSPKKMGEQKKQTDAQISTVTKEISYTVSVTCDGFKALPDVQVKYMLFYKDNKPGATTSSPSLSIGGAENFPEIGAHQGISFNTKPVALSTDELAAGWRYASGASGRSSDRISGVWVKVLSKGEVVGEYCNPPSISKKEIWKDY